MSNKYVFVDWSNVEPGYGTVWPYSKAPVISPYGIRIEAHKPYVEQQPVLLPDKPWESYCINSYATFIKVDGKIKVWYEVFSEAGLDDMKSNLAYAESEDGINFTKPILGIFPFNNSYDTNLIKNIHGTCVIYDNTAPLEERYKIIWVMYDRSKPSMTGCSLHGGVSADGINWTELDEPIFMNPGDTQNILDYDSDKKEYSIYTRQVKDYPLPRRSVSMTKSKSFSHFPDPQMIMHNYPTDPPDWDYYTTGYHKWPGAQNAHIMLMDIYKRTADTFEVHLLTSRDGIMWYRPMAQCAYIDKNSYGSENDMMISSTKGIIDNENGTWSFYINSTQNGHNVPPERRIKPTGAYRRATIREDGFTSITADGKASFYTIRLDVKSDCLMVNAQIPYGGWIKASIVDGYTCEPIEGFDIESCDALDTALVWQSVSWNKKGDLSALKSGSYRICFEMFKAKLYAFKI